MEFQLNVFGEFAEVTVAFQSPELGCVGMTNLCQKFIAVSCGIAKRAFSSWLKAVAYCSEPFTPELSDGPNGHFIYFKQEAPIDDGKSASVNLFKIDITGFRETRIVTPTDGSDPAWSPLLPN